MSNPAFHLTVAFAAFLQLGLLCAEEAAAPKGAVVFQEDFEKDPLWSEERPWKAMNPALKVEWDSKVFHGGTHSLKVSTSKFVAESKGVISERYFPYDGGRVKLSYWVKCEGIKSADVNPWDLGNLTVDYYDSSKGNIVYKGWKYHDNGKGMEGSSDWELVEKTLDIPKRETGVAFLRVWIDLYNCSGTMWVDDIKIERVQEKPKPAVSQEEWLSKISGKKGRLEAQVWELEGLLSSMDGRDAMNARVALTTCKVFLKYLPDDVAGGQAGRVGESEVDELVAKGRKSLPYDPKNEAFLRVYYQYVEGGGFALADSELDACLKLLGDAIASLKERRPQATAPDDSQAGLSVKDGSFVNKDGRPVFLMGFSFDGGKIDPSFREGLGCNFCGGFWGGALSRQFFKDDVEAMIPWQTDRMIDDMKRHPGMAADFLFMLWRPESVPAWMLAKDRSIEAKGNHFNGSDPDHPFIAKYEAQVYPSVAKALAPHNGTTVPMILYNLHNEPGFNSYGKFSKEKLSAWLRVQYGGDIGKLNRLYGTSCKDFSEVQKNEKGPLAQRYDWFRFNHERIAAMFVEERRLVKGSDPKALCHIKLMPNYWDIESLVWPAKDGGINYELLEPAMDVMGVDMSVRERSVAGYGMEFRAQGMDYDFYKSIAPEKPVFDSEWHGIGVNTALTDDAGFEGMSPEYAKASMWHAFLHGLRGMEIWFWSRYWNMTLPDLEPAREFNGSILTMPLVLEAFGRSAFDLRRLAPSVVPFAQEGSKARIFFSEPSRLLTTRYIRGLMKAYEAMNFMDCPARFLTDSQAAKGVPKGVSLLLVPPSPYVGDAAYGEVLSFAKRGGEIVLVGDESLSMTERGEPRDVSELKACPSVRTLPSLSRDGYRRELEPALARAGVERRVRALNPDGSFADKIELRSLSRDGRLLCYVINLDDKPRDLTLTKDGAPLESAADLISGRRLSGASFTMGRLEVMLLSID